jgi:hypothetical protein
MGKKIFLLVILGLVMINLPGCSLFQREIEPADIARTRSYFNFEDIKVPQKLKLDRGRSFVYDAAGFKAGTLYFSGNVEVNSLAAFFTDSMLKDGWRLKSSFRYPKMVLLFEKKGKSCIIIIEEDFLNTRVEIWVAPTN